MRRWLSIGAAAFLTLSAAAWGADWPTYRGDRERSGATREKLALPLAPAWVFQPRHAPRPAWGEPNPRRVGGWHGAIEGRRNHFDDAFQVAVADGAPVSYTHLTLPTNREV